MTRTPLRGCVLKTNLAFPLSPRDKKSGVAEWHYELPTLLGRRAEVRANLAIHRLIQQRRIFQVQQFLEPKHRAAQSKLENAEIDFDSTRLAAREKAFE